MNLASILQFFQPNKIKIIISLLLISVYSFHTYFLDYAILIYANFLSSIDEILQVAQTVAVFLTFPLRLLTASIHLEIAEYQAFPLLVVYFYMLSCTLYAILAFRWKWGLIRSTDQL